MLALKAWYCDSTHRYAMTDAVQPLIVKSASARRPDGDPKADLRALLHAGAWQPSASIRPAIFGGEIVEVDARLRERFGAYCWFVDVGLRQRRARPSRPDGRGAHGLARGLPDLRRERQRPRRRPTIPGTTRRSDVDIFHESDGDRPRARSAPTAISTAASSRASPTRSSTARRCAAPTSRTASPRSAPWSAIAQSVATGRPVALAEVIGRGLMQLGIFAKTFPGQRSGDACSPRSRDAGLRDDPVQHGLLRARSAAGSRSRERRGGRDPARRRRRPASRSRRCPAPTT